MKKLLITLAALLVFTGCAKAPSTAQVSDSEKVIWKSPKSSFTKGDLNVMLKSSDYSNLAMPSIIKLIGEAEGLDIEAYETAAKDYIEEMKNAGYSYYINYYYGSEAIFINNYISNEIITALTKADIEADLDRYIADYVPYKAEIAYFDTPEACEEVKKMVTEGKTFAYSAAKAGYSNEVAEKVYCDNDDQPLEVKEYMLKKPANGLSEIITTEISTKDSEGKESTNPRYYLINVIATDVENFKEDFINRVVSDQDSETVIANLLKKHKVVISDQATYDLLTGLYEVLK